MATSLGKVGIVDRGNYLQEETYNAGDFVLYNGSTWLALKDGLLGAEPAEGTNWKYLARGFEAEVLSMIAANDTSGLIGEAGQQVNAQSLIDVIADKVANRLIDKGLIANNLVTDNTEMVLAAPMGKELKRQLDEQNNNINSIERFTVTAETTLNDITKWLMNKFQTGLRSVNIYQGEKIVIFNQLGNFNIICTKFIAGDQFTGIAINHWDRNVYSVGIDASKSIKWEKLTINSDLSWKTLGYYEQGVEVSLPSSFTELLVVIYINGWAFTLPITYITLTDSERGYLGGSTWNTSSNYYGYHVNCSKTKIILRNANFGGTTAEAKAMAVYYR